VYPKCVSVMESVARLRKVRRVLRLSMSRIGVLCFCELEVNECVPH